jgi:hypothetical protein
MDSGIASQQSFGVCHGTRPYKRLCPQSLLLCHLAIYADPPFCSCPIYRALSFEAQFIEQL